MQTQAFSAMHASYLQSSVRIYYGLGQWQKCSLHCPLHAHYMPMSRFQSIFPFFWRLLLNMNRLSSPFSFCSRYKLTAINSSRTNGSGDNNGNVWKIALNITHRQRRRMNVSRSVLFMSWRTWIWHQLIVVYCIISMFICIFSPMKCTLRCQCVRICSTYQLNRPRFTVERTMRLNKTNGRS